MPSNKPQRSTFHKRLEHMVEVLRRNIITGKYAVGDLLPSNAELGKHYGLSKNSIRKGLDTLSQENLIVRVPKVGAKVASPQQSDIITIRLGCYNNMDREAALTEILDAFHTQYPHIRVQTLILPFDSYFENVTNYIDNDWLDVMMVNHSDFDFFRDEARSQLLEELESAHGLYNFVANAFSYHDRLLALPFIFSPIVLCYNKEHFTISDIAEPNSSWTWDDLMKAASNLSEKSGNYGFYYHMRSSNRWPVMLLQNGFKLGEVGEHGDSAKMNFVKSIELCRKLIVDQSYSPLNFSESDSDVEELFRHGKVSMIISTYFSLNKLRNSNVAFDVAPLPSIQDPKTILLTTGLAISAKTKEKSASRTLLDFMISYQAQLIIRKQTVSIPSLARAAEWVGTETINRPSRYHMYREIIPTFRFMNDLNIRNEDLIRIRKELMLFWAGMESGDTFYNRLGELFEIKGDVRE